MEVYWPDKDTTEQIYVCRCSSAGVGPQGLMGMLVSYRAPLGRLAEIPAGDKEEILLPGGRRRLAEIAQRIQLHPRLDDAGWDSRDNEAEFAEWQVVIESLRRLIERVARTRGAVAEVDYLAQVFADEEARTLYVEQRRRRTVDRMVLRDQPILDQYQGAVFRRPLDCRTTQLSSENRVR